MQSPSHLVVPLTDEFSSRPRPGPSPGSDWADMQPLYKTREQPWK